MTLRSRFRRLLFLTGAAALAAAPAAAQPPAVSPPTREDIQRPELQAPPGPPPGPRLTVEGDIERAPCPLAEPRFQSVTVTLNGVVFDNLRGLSQEDLRSAYAPYIGRTVPIAAVCEIRDAAATILRRAGYLAAVQTPPQRIENGVVRFDVLMAKVVRIQVRGNAGRSERLIAAYLERLKNDEVFNQNNAERYLLLARDAPGYDVRLVLRPAGTAVGEVVGEVTVVHTPYDLSAAVQNYGSKEVGRWGGLVRAQAYGLTGLGDRTSLGLYSTADGDEQRLAQLDHEFRIGPEGLTAGAHLTIARSRPDLGGAGALVADALVGAVDLSYPFVRSQARNLRGTAGFELINQDVDFNRIGLTEDRLRVLFARLDFAATDRASVLGGGGYSAAEPRWQAAATLELRQGLDVFDASGGCGAPPAYAACFGPGATPLSRVEADPTAFVARLEGRAEYRPTPMITLALAPRLQYADRPLVSYEELSVGTYTVGRGYDPGALLGDRGAGFSAELRLGTAWPRSQNSWAAQPYAFYDAAWVWNEDSAAPYLGGDPAHLASAGGGVRFAIGDHARLDVGFAKPLERDPVTQRRPAARGLVSLTTRLWPWAIQ